MTDPMPRASADAGASAQAAAARAAQTDPSASVGPQPGHPLPGGPTDGAPPRAATEAAGRTARAARPPQAPGLLATLQSIWRELPGLVSDRVDLLALELQRAGRALAQIVALVVATAILGVTAWLALWAGITVGLVELGLHWSLALLVVLLLNAVVAGLALARLRLLLPLLRLPATRRHLTPGRSAEESLPPAVAKAAGAPPPPDTPAAPMGQAG